MISTRYITLFLLFLTPSFQHTHQTDSTPLPTTHFQSGERLTYRVHYGLVAAGLVHASVDQVLHTIDGHTCYKIDVHGESQGLLYVVLKIKNSFTSYVDTHRLIPHLFCREIQEGTYRKYEKVTFDHLQQQAHVAEFDPSFTAVTKQATFTILPQVQDMVSQIYTYRNIDFRKLQAGDMLYSPVFHDNILHPDLTTKFVGRRKIKTKFGYVKAIVLAPIIPIHSSAKTIFANENSVELFLSDDANKLPLKIKVNLIVGAVELDLIEYEGIKTPLAVIK